MPRHQNYIELNLRQPAPGATKFLHFKNIHEFKNQISLNLTERVKIQNEIYKLKIINETHI